MTNPEVNAGLAEPIPANGADAAPDKAKADVPPASGSDLPCMCPASGPEEASA